MARLSVLVSVFVLVGVVVMAGFGVSGVVAQDATPAAGMAPSPEDCIQEPRTLEEVQAIAGEPEPEGAGEATSIARDADPEPFELPEGEAADEDVSEAIRVVVHQLFACHNAGHFLAGFGAVTDNFLESQVGLALFDEDFVEVMSRTPEALEVELHTILLDVREIVMYEDGRVGALVDYIGFTPHLEGIGGVETDLFIFAEVDGEWLLDESVENLEAQHGPEGVATPAAG